MCVCVFVVRFADDHREFKLVFAFTVVSCPIEVYQKLLHPANEV